MTTEKYVTLTDQRVVNEALQLLNTNTVVVTANVVSFQFFCSVERISKFQGYEWGNKFDG